MANVNAPFGFRPMMMTLAGNPVAVKEYAKPASDANAIFQFDLVKKVASSVPSPTGLTSGGLPRPSVQTGYQGTPGTTLWVGSSLNYGAASLATYHYVIDDVFAQFTAQFSGATNITVAASVGKNANISIATAGSTFTKQSGMQVDSATIATTAALDLRIYDLLNLTSNAEGANAVAIVTLMKSALAGSTAGV